MCSILSAAADCAVEELGAAKCAVPIIRGRGTACFEIHEAAVGTDRKEDKQ